MPSPRQLVQLVVGCVVLGLGVAMLLTADLGSDGYSTMVNGIALASGMSFLLANTLVSVAFLALAALRQVIPGIGTVVQVVVVGVTVDVLLGAWDPPESWAARIALLVLAFPVLAVGIATYLGSHTGAGPAEAAALAYDPPLPFRWSYSVGPGRRGPARLAARCDGRGRHPRGDPRPRSLRRPRQPAAAARRPPGPRGRNPVPWGEAGPRRRGAPSEE